MSTATMTTMQDDARPSPKATRLVESLTSEQPGFVPLVATVELVWVLQAQRRFAIGGADFADCMIERIAQAQGCRVTMTFDAGAAKAAGMTLVT